MRLHRFLALAAVALPALALAACSPQAEATDADLVAEAPAEDGGRSAPGHFALVGPTDEWVGAAE